MIQNNDALVVPYFKHASELDEAASKKAGRPIYRDVELVDIRIAGDRYHQPTKKAHEFWKHVDGIAMTYAMRWPEQYKRFKESTEQVAHGTPLTELPFLTEARRGELRALRVYTAEALAAIDGTNLKALGIDGRRMKEQAQAYLDAAASGAGVAAMADELAVLRARVAELEKAEGDGGAAADETPPADSVPGYERMSDDAIKELIAARTGARPRGNPSRETLLRMAKEAEGA